MQSLGYKFFTVYSTNTNFRAINKILMSALRRYSRFNYQSSQ